MALAKRSRRVLIFCTIPGLSLILHRPQVYSFILAMTPSESR
jgi:hypothetical protein